MNDPVLAVGMLCGIIAAIPALVLVAILALCGTSSQRRAEGVVMRPPRTKSGWELHIYE